MNVVSVGLLGIINTAHLAFLWTLDMPWPIHTHTHTHTWVYVCAPTVECAMLKWKFVFSRQSGHISRRCSEWRNVLLASVWLQWRRRRRRPLSTLYVSSLIPYKWYEVGRHMVEMRRNTYIFNLIRREIMYEMPKRRKKKSKRRWRRRPYALSTICESHSLEMYGLVRLLNPGPRTFGRSEGVLCQRTGNESNSSQRSKEKKWKTKRVTKKTNRTK